MSNSVNKSFFGAVKAPVISIASAVATTADTVNYIATVGKVQSQNLLAETLLDGHTNLISKHGENVAEKLQNSKSFYDSLGL